MHRRARRPMMCDEPLAADHWKELPERAIPFFAGCGDLIGFRSSCGFPPPPCFPIECNCHQKCNKTGDNPGIWPLPQSRLRQRQQSRIRQWQQRCANLLLTSATSVVLRLCCEYYSASGSSFNKPLAKVMGGAADAARPRRRGDRMSGLISRLWPSALVGLSFGRLIGPNLIRTLPTTSSLPPEIIGVRSTALPWKNVGRND